MHTCSRAAQGHEGRLHCRGKRKETSGSYILLLLLLLLLLTTPSFSSCANWV
jgi:hypothetical protein